jgi:uncharacterized membrane protein (GlpM family)
LKKTVDPKLLALYFVIGGLVVSVVTYFGSQGKSELAVFIAFLPGTTLITLVTIYLSGGTGAAVSYAKSMLILLPAWVLYVVGVIFLLPRLGLALSLVVSVAAYLGAAFLTMKLT